MANSKENLVNEIVSYYGINSNVEYVCTLDKDIEASYEFETDTIEICDRRVDSLDKFKKTLLHEIGHALQTQELGVERFTELYNNEWEALETLGKDPYWDNKYEVRAERFANQEMKNW